jgi:hypothetical protein
VQAPVEGVEERPFQGNRALGFHDQALAERALQVLDAQSPGEEEKR